VKIAEQTGSRRAMEGFMLTRIFCPGRIDGVCRCARVPNGLAMIGLLLLFATTADAQEFKLLYSFHGDSGAYPLAGVIVDSQRNIYGTTSEGGAHGMGTVFKVDATGEETVLHSFKGAPSDGNFPIAGLVRDQSGNLYGTTTRGGSSNYGTVFKVAADGEEQVLYSFGHTKEDGRYPSAGLLLDCEGNLYGTTQEGGTRNFGTVFKIDSDGNETVLHNFAGNPTDGQYPVAGLIRDDEGNFYGTAEIGGTFNDGVVFKLAKNGKETVIFSFAGGAGGNYMLGGVVRDSAGNLFGTATYGSNEFGLVFELDSIGKETVLFTFNGNDGAFPSAGVIRAPNGTLYGTTEFGGKFNSGIIFSLNSSGVEKILHSFDGSDGPDLFTALFRDDSGDLYGTATEGGAYGQGTVFKLTP
jgi:uncharacterized repeat protein (TIGR03803 family)